MYDVYNNGWILGGKLNVNLERYLQVSCGEIFAFKNFRNRPKYVVRSNMTDILLRIGVVVDILSFFLHFFHFSRKQE